MPVDVTGVPSMYVFVDIGIDVAHLADSVWLNFERGGRLALAGTIQFAGSIQACLNPTPSPHPYPYHAPDPSGAPLAVRRRSAVHRASEQGATQTPSVQGWHCRRASSRFCCGDCGLWLGLWSLLT